MWYNIVMNEAQQKESLQIWANILTAHSAKVTNGIKDGEDIPIPVVSITFEARDYAVFLDTLTSLIHNNNE